MLAAGRLREGERGEVSGGVREGRGGRGEEKRKEEDLRRSRFRDVCHDLGSLGDDVREGGERGEDGSELGDAGGREGRRKRSQNERVANEREAPRESEDRKIATYRKKIPDHRVQILCSPGGGRTRWRLDRLKRGEMRRVESTQRRELEREKEDQRLTELLHSG